MNPGWFFRMAKWLRHPPSARQVRLGLIVLGICLGLLVLERTGLLPGWFALDPKSLKP